MFQLIGLLLLVAIEGWAATAQVPLFFIPNQGQARADFRYLVETPDVRAGFAADGVVFQIHGQELRVGFRGANAETAIEGEVRLRGRANFFTGSDPAAWRTQLPTYSRLVYHDLYPGIDLNYAGSGARIKSEFKVEPGADPAIIQMNYGEGSVAILAGGSLVVSAGAARLTEDAPVAYQETAHGRVMVDARYVLLDRHTAGFAIGEYDRGLPLVIDPVISYSTYIGGSGMGAVTGVAIDGAGNLYATGWTEALNFPISGAVQVSNRGGVDAFVIKLTPDGRGIVYSTYIGGRGDDRAAAIAVDSSGHAWVTGSTASPDFPTFLASAPTFGGAKDAFVLKLHANGGSLLFSTFLGGVNTDLGTAIAVDASGNAYVAGDTLSSNFPVKTAAQPSLAGKTDAFVTKFTTFYAIGWSTLLGGSGDEHAGGVAVDSAGSVYVAGGTSSPNFPLAGSFQSTLHGGQDAFVTKISSDGVQFLYSTYLGGNGGGSGNAEQANAIALDSSGSAYLAGVTNSTDFPVSAGAFQASASGAQDVFVTKMTPAGNAVSYSTYLGGASFDWATAIAVGANGNAYVAGYTSSLGFPVTSPVQPAFNGLYDAFVTQLSPTGNAAVFSTFFGGTGSDAANAIAVDFNGNMFVGGQSSSSDLQVVGAIQNSNTGGSTGWVARFGVTAPPPQVPSTISLSPSAGSGNTATFTAQYSHPAGATSLTTVSLLINTTASPDYGCYITYTRSTNLFALFNNVASTGSFPVTPNTGGSQQNTQCSLKGTGSFASLSGNILTLTVTVTFLPPFPGTKTVYLAAADASSSTGWVARGTFNVVIPAAQPAVGSVTVSGSTFSVVYSDSQSVNNITGVGILINTTSGSTINSCEIYFDRNVNTIQLFWDNIVASDSRPLSSSTPLTNSQCIVGSVTASVSGLSLVVTANVIFKSSFTGPKTIFGWAADGTTNTGWVSLAAYNVTVGGVPAANSVVPSTGSGPSQRFTFTVSDQGGSFFIKFVGILFASTLNFDHACYLKYDPNVNQVSVEYDIAGTGATAVTPGTNGIATSSQCVLQALNTQIVTNSTSVIITVDITFTATFAGNKFMYLYAGETSTNSGWVQVGNWTATGGSPTADSMSPSSGTSAVGASQTFTFTVSDSASQLNINGIEMLFTTGSPATIVNQCHLAYNRTNITIGLYNDAHTSISTKGIGDSTQLFNSQCWVGFTAWTTPSNSVAFVIELQFKAPFVGSKSVYVQAKEVAANSGWVSRGTWTVQ